MFSFLKLHLLYNYIICFMPHDNILATFHSATTSAASANHERKSAYYTRNYYIKWQEKQLQVHSSLFRWSETGHREWTPQRPKAKGPDPVGQLSSSMCGSGKKKQKLQQQREALDAGCLCGFPIGRCFPVCRGSRTVPGFSVLWAGLNQTHHIPTSIALKDVTLATQLLQPDRRESVHCAS